ncbi:oxygen-dependent choline dehydrogenase-like [Oppia nitens]|uniref:oxygen-dependent choline dehydrogenase-like n=1 Tax=Oppia nitens TaxID=1686743 RepID=UPI0023D97A31|nr:oxygen-dependent choline dehydrogenase-like [Oppia nitens]
MYTLTILAQIYLLYNIISQRQHRHNQLAYRTPLPPKPRYDYIVVGSGSAGAIVSCRLSQWGWDVLLLEAGGPSDALLEDIPALGLPYQSLHKQNYWSYRQSVQKYTSRSLEIIGRHFEPKGRVLGGSSTVNYMAYNRGNRKYYDMIASKYGAIGWDYASVLPVFKLMENNTDPRVMDEYHGRQGPVRVSTPSEPLPIYLKQAQAAREWGLDLTDVNGPNQTGFSFSQSTSSDGGLRSSTLNAYLLSGLCPQLTIVTGAQVSKVLIKRNPTDNQPPRAQGVEFIKSNRTYSVWTKREVIVSAGTIVSPQLLMLSGIGPAGHLQDTGLGIREVYADLPGVGQNYCNHLAVSLDFPIRQPGMVGPWPTWSNLTQLYDTTVLGRGPLARQQYSLMYWSSTSGGDGGVDTDDYPDIYVISLTSNRQARAMLASPVRPVSCGIVRLNSSRIEDQPVIDPQFLSAKIDRLRIREAIIRTFRFVETTSFSQYVSIPSQPLKNCQYCPTGPVYQCLSYIDCLIREWAGTHVHPVGTCRMGDPGRRDTVVDPRLRVKGIRGLRVCDASVYPEIINANTNAGAMLAGEMGARFIHEDNQ